MVRLAGDYYVAPDPDLGHVINANHSPERGEYKMNTNKKTAGNLVDVRIILTALWIARMLSGLQRDTVRLSDPVALQSILANN